MSSTRVGWVGGKTKGRDHFPVIARPYGVIVDEGPSVALPRTPYLSEDWTAAIVRNDEHHEVSAEWAENRGAGTMFPFGFTLNEQMEYFARIRQWSLQLDATMAKSVAKAPEPDSPPFYEWQYATISVYLKYKFAVAINSLVGIPQKETDLLSSVGQRYVEFSVFDDGFSSNTRPDESPSSYSGPLIENMTASISPIPWIGNQSPGGSSLFFNLRQSLTPAFGVAQAIGFPTNDPDMPGGGWYGGLWYPVIEFTMGNSAGDEIPGAGSSWRGRGDSEPWAPRGTFTFNGKTTSIYGSAQPSSPDDEPGWIGYTAVDLEIKPLRYWPYANKAGDPVYDEDTGDELVDPFS